MNKYVKNLLYDRPMLYESLYPERNDETPTKCRLAFERYLKKAPSSILDIACGTGRDIRSLHKNCDDCVGVDFLPQMIEYAKTKAPAITFVIGDMRTTRLDRTFDVIVCLGSALLYALSNKDLDHTFETFAVHAHDGSLLILDLRNAAALFGDGFRQRIEGCVDSPQLKAQWVAEHSLDRRNQRLIRKRTWHLSDGSVSEDYCEYRLLLPGELERLTISAGFKLLGMFDNMELKTSDFTGPTLYLLAEKVLNPVAVGDPPANGLLSST